VFIHVVREGAPPKSGGRATDEVTDHSTRKIVQRPRLNYVLPQTARASRSIIIEYNFGFSFNEQTIEEL
jgi:hypothetical protein